MAPCGQKPPEVGHNAPGHKRSEQIECRAVPANDEDAACRSAFVWILSTAHRQSLLTGGLALGISRLPW